MLILLVLQTNGRVDFSNAWAQTTSQALEEWSAMTSQQFIDYVQEHYGPVTSYTGARGVANLYQLVIDEGECYSRFHVTRTVRSL